MRKAVQGEPAAVIGVPELRPGRRRYPTYRDSGIEWLGRVPGHWEVAPVYSRYDVALGKMLDAERITGQHLAPYVRNVDVQWDRVLVDDLPEMDFHRSERGRYRLQPGDLLVCEGGDIGRAATWRGELAECYYQKAIHRLRPRHAGECVRFLFYILRWAAAAGVFAAAANSNTIDHLTAVQLRHHRFPFPPQPEQAAIAAFLDRETARLDALVERKQRLAELLREKRAAVITRAVTRGLDPDVPMRESGVEWLGQVPRHWDLAAVRRAVPAIEQGWSPQAYDRSAEGDEWAVIKLSAVSKGVFRSEEHKALPPELSPEERLEIRPGDFLITRSNTPDLVGDTCVAESPRPRLMLCDLVYRLRIDPRRAVPRFLLYWLLAATGRFQITRDAHGTSQSMVKISQGHIRAWSVPLPPPEEQAAIAAYLDRETARLDALIAKIERAIALLREYRQALITAAVTGQIDVRGEAPA